MSLVHRNFICAAVLFIAITLNVLSAVCEILTRKEGHEHLASGSERTLLTVNGNNSSTQFVILNKFVLLALWKYYFLKYACAWPSIKYLLSSFCDPPAPQPVFVPVNVTVVPQIRYNIVTQYAFPWMEAHLYCKTNNSELTTVDSQQEFDLLVDLIKNAGLSIPAANFSFWTSGNDIYREGSFSWLSTAQPIPLPFLPAGNTQPNNAGGNENCVNLWDITGNGGFILNDLDCTMDNFFICKHTT